MNVVVRLFAAAREIAGCDPISVEIPSPATVGALRTALNSALPALAPLAERSLIAVNAAYADDGATISANDEVALIPPVSGG